MKKKILIAISVLSIVLLAIGGSLALLTSEDSDYNTMTVGKAKIEQIEQQRGEKGLEDFTQDKTLFPTTSKEVTKDEDNYFYASTVTNTQDKIVSVKNTGFVSVYYRTIIAVEAPAGAENAIVVNQNNNENIVWTTIDGTININGSQYKLLVATYQDKLLPAQTSEASLLQVYMTRNSTNETVALFGEKVDVLVMSQAVQSTGYASANEALLDAFGEVTTKSSPWTGTLVSTTEELEAAFKKGGIVTLTNDLEVTKIIELTGDTEVVFNANGKTVTAANSSVDPIFHSKDNSKLTITGNGVFDLEDHWQASITLPQDKATIIIENGTFKKNYSNDASLYGGGAILQNWNNGITIINGGYFDGGLYAPEDSYNTYRCNLNVAWGGRARVYGGTFVAQNPALGDEATGNQGFFLEGQSKSNPEIPSGFTITEGVTNDGTNRPTYTVTYEETK